MKYHNPRCVFDNCNMEHKIDLFKEDIECVHMYLDDKEIPRIDTSNGKTYSLVGRIKLLEKLYYKELSDLETYYLNKQNGA